MELSSIIKLNNFFIKKSLFEVDCFIYNSTNIDIIHDVAFSLETLNTTYFVKHNQIYAKAFLSNNFRSFVIYSGFTHNSG